eukprot:scaffold7773_cov110-Isochrysis_galbana.AAC.9
MIIGGETGREETAVGVDDATKGCLPRGVLSSRALPGGHENPRPLRSIDRSPNSSGLNVIPTDSQPVVCEGGFFRTTILAATYGPSLAVDVMKDLKMSIDEHPMTSALSMHRMNVRRNCSQLLATSSADADVSSRGNSIACMSFRFFCL